MDEKMFAVMMGDLQCEAAFDIIERFSAMNKMSQECVICTMFDTMVSQHDLDVDETLTEITGAIRDVNETCGRYVI